MDDLSIPDASLTRNPAPFVVGMSRSGTTLLRLMLDAHPELAIPPETHFIPVVAKACQTARDPRAAFLHGLTSTHTWSDFHIAADVLETRIANIEPFNMSDALRALYGLYAEGFGKPRWGDKTNHLWNLTVIQDLLPEARFIHIVRDGRDVALSIKDLWWGPNSVAEAAQYWKSGIQKARSQVVGLHHYREIRFEDLVLDTERHLRQLCDFIELAWHPAMLEYHRNAEDRLMELTSFLDPKTQKVVTVEERRSTHTYVKLPPDASRTHRWRREMTATEREEFAAIAGQMLDEFDYDQE